jgi:hypothetical protein
LALRAGGVLREGHIERGRHALGLRQNLEDEVVSVVLQ